MMIHSLGWRACDDWYDCGSYGGGGDPVAVVGPAACDTGFVREAAGYTDP